MKREKAEEIKFLTQKETEKFFNAIKKCNGKFSLRDYTAFRIIYICGLRASELQLMKKSDFREGANEIFCRRLKGSINNTIRITKKEDQLLIKRYLKEYKGNKLYEINNEEDFLFKGKNGKPLELEAIRFLFKQYSKLAKLPKDKQHPHVLKHSIAVHIAESGADVKDLQAYLGHKNINNTQIYFQYTTKQQDAFYNKIINGNSIA